ncbi:hypothetical protein XENOCAPTIV_020249 [Xenoophorus captivus]|uniref:Uncharacterized protein n=1 Tax=Xenoophorus captivus TaxID=1517983 RepID=A0ABV0RT48_9TELE
MSHRCALSWGLLNPFPTVLCWNFCAGAWLPQLQTNSAKPGDTVLSYTMLWVFFDLHPLASTLAGFIDCTCKGIKVVLTVFCRERPRLLLMLSMVLISSFVPSLAHFLHPLSPVPACCGGWNLSQ